MRRRIIDVSTLAPIRKGRPERVKTLKASPAEIAIARQMARRERDESETDDDDAPNHPADR